MLAVLVVVALLSLQAQATQGTILLDLPDELLEDILFRHPGNVVLARCAQTCQTVRRLLAGPLRFRHLLHGLTQESDDLPVLYGQLQPGDVRLPDLTAEIPQPLLDSIRKLASSYSDKELPENIVMIRDQYPPSLQGVFPNQLSISNSLLLNYKHFPQFRSPHLLRILHLYGIAFDTAIYMSRIRMTSDSVSGIYPLLRPTANAVLSGFPLVDVLFSSPDTALVEKLFQMPEFLLRFQKWMPQFLSLLPPIFEDRSISLDPLLSLPSIRDLVRIQSSKFGESLLHMAFRNGRIDVAERLLEFDADPAVKDNFERTAIRYLSSDLESVTAFLSLLPRYPQLDRVLRANWSEFVSVLNDSLSRGATDVVRLALQQEFCDDFVNVPDFKTVQSLVECVFKYDHLDLVPDLLEISSFKLDVKDYKGRSSISHLQTKSVAQFLDLLRIPQVHDLLMNNMPDMVGVLGTAMSAYDAHVVNIAMKYEWFMDLVDLPCSFKQWTLLHYAVFAGKIRYAAKLLSYPNVNKYRVIREGDTFERLAITTLHGIYSVMRACLPPL